MDMQLQSLPTTPAGMLTTIHGQTLPDCGRSRLTAMLQEAYELHNAHVAMRLDGGETVLVPLTDALMRELQANPEPRTLGGVDLGEPAGMDIQQIDERAWRLTEVLESWQGVPRVSTLRFAYDNPYDDAGNQD
jgi:hypothetical protein